MSVQELKLAILPLDLPQSRLTHSGEILTTGKLHKKKPGGLFCHYVELIRVLQLTKSRIFFSFLTKYLQHRICKCYNIDDFVLLK